MKTYKERLPEIDKAIFELGGELPEQVLGCIPEEGDCLILCVKSVGIFKGGGYYIGNQRYDKDFFKSICEMEEAEARVADWRRLYGWRKIKYPSICSFAEWLNMARNKAELSGALITKGKAEHDSFNWQLSLDDNRHGSVKPDIVNHPGHYAFFDGTEAIEIIASSMSEEQFRGYCIGNKLKYCLRAGKKGDALEDLAKADKYEELFNKFKDLCQQ